MPCPRAVSLLAAASLWLGSDSFLAGEIGTSPLHTLCFQSQLLLSSIRQNRKIPRCATRVDFSLPPVSAMPCVLPGCLWPAVAWCHHIFSASDCCALSPIATAKYELPVSSENSYYFPELCTSQITVTVSVSCLWEHCVSGYQVFTWIPCLFSLYPLDWKKAVWLIGWVLLIVIQDA